MTETYWVRCVTWDGAEGRVGFLLPLADVRSDPVRLLLQCGSRSTKLRPVPID